MNSDKFQDVPQTYKFYSELFDEYGPTAQGLGWGTKGLQHLRFETLTSPWILKGLSILDVGCGVCDLFEFLLPKEIKSYTGIDFVDSYCAYARSRFPHSIFDLVKADIYSLPEFPICDIALVSGTFNVMDSRSEDENYQRIQSVMSKMHKSTNVGFSINFLNDATTYRVKSLFYANSETILAIARGISRRVAISHFEFPFEYTIHVWCRDAYNSDTSLYTQT